MNLPTRCPEAPPAFAYGLLYLLFIPLFALAYSTIPSDFRRSDTSREPGFLARETSAKNRLAQELDAAASFVWSDSVIAPWTVQPKVASLAFRGGGTTSALAEYQVTISISATRDTTGTEHAFDLLYHLDIWDPFLPTETTIPLDGTGFANIEANLAEFHPFFSIDQRQLSTLQELFTNRWATVHFPVSLRTFAEIAHLEQSRSGYGRRTDYPQYLRMLYFSASTITTLGLGDIAPLTDRARFIVTVEAVVGVVLVGLFLTALASGRTHSHPTPPTPVQCDRPHGRVAESEWLSKTGFAIYGLLKGAGIVAERGSDSSGHDLRGVVRGIEDAVEPYTELIDWNAKTDVQREMRKQIKRRLPNDIYSKDQQERLAAEVIDLLRVRKGR